MGSWCRLGTAPSRSAFSWSLRAQPELHFTHYPKQKGHVLTLGGILAVNAAVFAGWRVAPFMGADFHQAWSDTWYQKRGGLEQGKLWQLFTPSLSHQDWAHMSGNMVLFLYLGKRLHELLGRARFLGPCTIRTFPDRFTNRHILLIPAYCFAIP